MLVTLEDYRTRHAQYKTDVDLQHAHALVPWITIWDDHESADNSWENGAAGHKKSQGEWILRKKASVQAYYEYMPIRQVIICIKKRSSNF